MCLVCLGHLGVFGGFGGVLGVWGVWGVLGHLSIPHHESGMWESGSVFRAAGCSAAGCSAAGSSAACSAQRFGGCDTGIGGLRLKNCAHEVHTEMDVVSTVNDGVNDTATDTTVVLRPCQPFWWEVPTVTSVLNRVCLPLRRSCRS